MNRNLFTIILLAFLSAVIMNGCGNSSTTTLETNETNVSKTSFLSGGTYGKLSYKIVEYNGSTDLPYLSGWRINNVNSEDTHPVNSDLPFTVYGGALSTYGDNYQVYGNTAVNAPVKLKYLLVPNLAVTPLNKPVNFGIGTKVGNSVKCILQRDNGGLYESPVAEGLCERAPLISNVVLTKPNQAIEVEVDLGEFDKSDHTSFTIYQKFPTTRITSSTAAKTAESFTASTTLNINSLSKTPLPPNVIAYGDFLPTPDGFGFSNYGSIDPNALTNEDVAEMYGADAVCFNADEKNCALSSYGAFLKQGRTKINHGACYGFAISSMMLKKGIPFKGKSKPSDYNPKAKDAISLNHSDVARLLAYKFNNQFTPEMMSYYDNPIDGTYCRNMTIKDILDMTIKGFKSDDPIAELGMYSLNIGHSVTPYAVSKITDDNYRIYIYDNNYPGDSDRYIDTNISTNSFYYNGSLNSAGSSVIYSDKHAPLCATPLSMQQYYKINIQPINSIEFSVNADMLEIINKQSRVNHIDVSNKKKTINIPDTTLNARGSSLLLTIKEETNLESLKLITSRAALEPYLKDSYVVGYKPKNIDSASIGFSSLAKNYANGAEISQTYQKDDNSSMNYLIHPSSRIVVANNPNNLMLSLFVDNNKKRIGYIYTIKVTDLIPSPNVSLGALITDDGELEVFVFDNTTFDRLNGSINYTITASIQNINGVFPMASKKVSQAINSAVKASYKPNDKIPLSNSKKTGSQVGGGGLVETSVIY